MTRSVGAEAAQSWSSTFHGLSAMAIVEGSPLGPGLQEAWVLHLVLCRVHFNQCSQDTGSCCSAAFVTVHPLFIVFNLCPSAIACVWPSEVKGSTGDVRSWLNPTWPWLRRRLSLASWLASPVGRSTWVAEAMRAARRESSHGQQLAGEAVPVASSPMQMTPSQQWSRSTWTRLDPGRRIGTRYRRTSHPHPPSRRDRERPPARRQSKGGWRAAWRT
jgi:hypothetical protein